MGRPPLGKRRIQVKISPAVLAALDVEAKAHDHDRSSLIEHVVRLYLKRRGHRLTP